MQPWAERAVEEAYLFNPAFCATLLAKATEDYFKKTGRPLPFALAFLILPIVLHQATRTALPNTTITSLLTWSQDHRERLVGFESRVRNLRTITREAIIFGLTQETFALDANGDLSLGSKRKAPTEKRTELFTEEVRECVDRAGFIGRWFASAGTTSVIYSAWGIAP